MNKLSILVIAILSTWMFTSCGSEETVKKDLIRPVKSMVIGDVIDPTGKGYPGVTKESQESEISFRVGGPIVKYNVVEGSQVMKGDLIAEIDPRDYKITVQSTFARYDQAKTEAERYFRLWKKGSVAKNDYDRKNANAQEAKAAWEDAKNALSDTRLLAPFTGFYGPKLSQLGDKVRVKQAITTLVDLSVIEINTTIPEQLAIQFRNFDRYEVHLETYPDVVFTATIKDLEKKPTAEGFPLHLYLNHINKKEDTTQVKVGAGMSCRVNIFLKESSNVQTKIIIPLSSIFEGEVDKSTMVWIIDNDSSTVKKQSVVIGKMIGHDAVEITDGLELGQRIVIAGVHRLIEGEKVNDINILESN